MDNKLFNCIRESNTDKQLIVFPYLGGSANTLMGLMQAIKDTDIEIWAANPPGHIGSALVLEQDMNTLTDIYCSELKDIVKPECYLFGYSMGGNIIYFISQKWEQNEMNRDWLKGLIISASGPPCMMYNTKTSEQPNNVLLDKLMKYKALPEEVLESEELMEMLLPIFRADYRIIETGAEIEINKKSDIDHYLIWGDADPSLPVEDLSKWRKYFDKSGTVLPVRNGTHMFVHQNTDTVAQYVQNIFAGVYRSEDDF